MTLLRAGAVVAGFVLLGRLTGFLREIVIAQVGGASTQTDLMVILLTFPDMLIGLVMGGGIMAALVPAFSRLSAPARAALLLRAGAAVLAAATLLAAVIALETPRVLGLLAPGWSAEAVADAAPAFRTILVAVPVTALSGVCVAYLNSQGRFAFGAVGTLIVNACVIAALLGVATPALAITVGVLAGTGIRFAVQGAVTLRRWTRPDFAARYDGPALLSRFAGSFGFFSVILILPPLARAYASMTEPGALSLFNYAYKLMELPMVVIVSAIATVLLPRLSGEVRDGPPARSDRTVGTALRALLALLLVASVTTVAHADAVVRLVFHGAPFGDGQEAALAAIVAIGFLGVPFQGLVAFLATVLISHDRTGPLVAVSATMAATMAALGHLLQAHWGLSGVMAAYAAAYATGAVLQTALLIRTVGAAPLRIAAERAGATLAAPVAAGLAAATGGRALEVPGPVGIVLTAGTMLAVYVAADGTLLRALRGRVRP